MTAEDATRELRDRLDALETRTNETDAAPREPAPFDMTAIVAAVALAMRAMPTTATLPAPPTYNGEGDTLEWSTFLELFQRNLQLNGWNVLPTDQRARLLQSSLRLQAANVFVSLSETQKNDYDQAVTALTRIFVNPAKITLYQNEFDERQQKKSESLQELAMSLKKLVKKAYPEIREQRAYDALANRRFVEAIADVNLKNHVRMWRKETLDTTLIEAIRLEGALRQTAAAQSNVMVASVQHNGAQQWNRNDQPRNQPQRESRTCYYCNKPGHIKRDCHKFKADQEAQGNSKSYGGKFHQGGGGQDRHQLKD